MYLPKRFNFWIKSIKVNKLIDDGYRAKRGDIIAEVLGSLSNILQAERVALNLFQRMSGIATLTSKYVKAVRGSKAKKFSIHARQCPACAFWIRWQCVSEAAVIIAPVCMTA